MSHQLIREATMNLLQAAAICVTAFVGAAVAQATDPESAFYSDNDLAMTKMMSAMHTMPSGNVDKDFVAMMTPHHQGAIDMAQAEIHYGSNEQLRRLAQEIVVTQQQEIAAMKLAVSDVRDAAGRETPGREVSTRETPTREAPKREAPGDAAPVRKATVRDAPDPASDIPVSHRDRVYAAEQFSNTVSVTDPVDNRLLGVIRLGDPAPGNLSPLYRGQLLVHGMGFSPDHKTIAVVSIGSNSVAFIDTATNAVKHITYVGRSPHEAFFTPDGKELWVAVRGENYISVLDAKTYAETLRITVPGGPGMQIFSPDGKYGYVCSSFNPETVVITVADHQIVGHVTQPSPFCPNIAATPDGKQVWFTLKDVGKVVVFDARPPFAIVKTIDTGPITNHVNFAHNSKGLFAYVTVGGLNQVQVFRTSDFSKVATISVGKLPHGLWPSGDGTRMYVGIENEDRLTAIDTLTNTVIANVPIGQAAQAVNYVSNAVPEGDGMQGLQPLGAAGQSAQLTLSAAGTQALNGGTSAAGAGAANAQASSGEPSASTGRPNGTTRVAKPNARADAAGAGAVGAAGTAHAAGAVSAQASSGEPSASTERPNGTTRVAKPNAGAASAGGSAPTSVSLFDQGLLQVLQASVTGLEPKHPYVLALASEKNGTGNVQPLAAFNTNPAGAAIVNALGPIRQVVRGEQSAPRRYLVIAPGTPDSMGAPVQIQTE
jgi:YVTN family beta-propeller protein